MKIFLLLFASYFLASYAAKFHSPRTRRPYVPYAGIKELQEIDPACFNTRSCSKNIERDGFLFRYDITLQHGVYSVDEDANIVHIDCENDDYEDSIVVVHALNVQEAFARFNASRFVVGDHTWGCITSKDHDSPQPLYRQISKVTREDDVILVESVPILVSHLFEHASIRLKIPPRIFNNPSEYSLQQEASRNGMSSMSTYVFNSSVNYVYSANYNPATQAATQNSIPLPATQNLFTAYCENCYFTFNAGVTFELDVETDFYGFPTITYMYLDTHGGGSVSAYIRITNPVKGKTNEIALTSRVNFPSIFLVLFIVPFSLTPGVQLFGQAEIVQATLQPTVFCGFTASASLLLGMKMVGDVFTVMNSSSWDFSGTPLSLSAANNSGIFNPRIYLIPRVYLSPYGLVDFFVDVKPYVGVQMYMPSAGNPSNPNPGSVGVNNFNAGSAPTTPSPPTVKYVTAGMIGLYLTPPPSAFPVTYYSVEYKCYNCYNYYFTNVLNPSSIGFFYRHNPFTCVNSATSTAPFESTSLRSSNGTLLTCSDLCASNTDCYTFTWQDASKYCNLYAKTAVLNFNSDTSCSSWVRQSNSSSNAVIYEIRNNDILGYTASSGSQSTSYITIGLGDYYSVSPYAYQVRYAAISSRGQGPWSDYTIVQITFTLTTSVLTNNQYAKATWTTNLKNGEIITVNIYADDGTLSDTLIASSNVAVGSNSNSYTVLIGSNYPNCYANTGNSQNLYSIINYNGVNSWVTSANTPYSPVSSVTSSVQSAPASATFRFYAYPYQITKTCITIGSFGTNFFFTPMSQYCDANYYCTITASGFSSSSTTIYFYAYDAAGNYVQIATAAYTAPTVSASTVNVDNLQLGVTWETNIPSGQQMVIKWYTDGTLSDTNVVTSTVTLGSNSAGSYYTYLGNYYKNPYANYGSNQQYIYTTESYGTTVLATTSNVIYYPVSSISYSSTSTSVKFTFKANPTQITKARILLTYFGITYGDTTYSPLSNYCTSYQCTVQLSGYSAGSYSATLYAFDSVGTSLSLTTVTTSSSATMVEGTEVLFVLPGNLTSSFSDHNVSKSLRATETSEATQNNAVATKSFPRTDGAEEVVVPSPEGAFLTKELMLMEEVVTDATTTCPSGALLYSFYFGVALQAGMNQFTIPIWGLVLFPKMVTPQMSLIDPFPLPFTFATGCLQFPPLPPQLKVVSPTVSSKWGQNSNCHMIQWNYWNIADSATVTIKIYPAGSSTSIYTSSSIVITALSSSVTLSNTVFAIGATYVVKICADGTSTCGSSDAFQVVDPSEDLGCGTLIPVPALQTYNQNIPFSGLAFSSAAASAHELTTEASSGISISFDDGTGCQSQYASFPMNVLCTLNLNVKVGGSSIYSFQVYAGNYIESETSLTSSDGMQLTLGYNFPAFSFPQVPSSASYFFKTMLGQVLTPVNSFPFTASEKMFSMNVPTNDICLSNLIQQLSSSDAVSDDTKAAAERVANLLEMLGINACLIVNVKEASSGGMKFVMTSNMTLFDADAIDWSAFFNSIENEAFQKFLLISGSATEDMASSVFQMILSGLGLQSKVTYAYNVGAALMSLYTNAVTNVEGEMINTLGSSTTINFVAPDGTFLLGTYATGDTPAPSVRPSEAPTQVPTTVPSLAPTMSPSAMPTVAPSALPTITPTQQPTEMIQTANPSTMPTEAPSMLPTVASTVMPSMVPSALPTVPPSQLPSTIMPSISPSHDPTAVPSTPPTVGATSMPTVAATTMTPSESPTEVPSLQPNAVSVNPTRPPTERPSVDPSVLPTMAPTMMPTIVPTATPTVMPSEMPTAAPTVAPTFAPTTAPTLSPSTSPTTAPTRSPTGVPTATPTTLPSTIAPSAAPSATPSLQPDAVSVNPTRQPTEISKAPSAVPSMIPTVIPSAAPTVRPSARPSLTSAPSAAPVVEFSAQQTINGISYTTYQTDEALYNSVLAQTIASCMNGVAASDITNIVVAAPTSRRLSAIVSDATTDAILCSYIVRSADPNQSYATLSGELSTAVFNGVFTTNLNNIAADSGATAFVGCSSTSVITEPVDTSSSSSSNGLSTGAIVGIVIGVLIGIGMLIGIAYYFMVYNNGGTSGANGAATNNVNRSTMDSGRIVSTDGVSMTENPLRK